MLESDLTIVRHNASLIRDPVDITHVVYWKLEYEEISPFLSKTHGCDRQPGAGGFAFAVCRMNQS